MGKSSHNLVEKKFIGGLTENLNERLKCIEWRTGILDMSGFADYRRHCHMRDDILRL